MNSEWPSLKVLVVGMILVGIWVEKGEAQVLQLERKAIATASKDPEASMTYKIAYIRHQSYGSKKDINWEIYVINSDGSGLQRLTVGPQHGGPFDWSPDGEQIVFWSTEDSGSGDIYTVNTDGSGLKNLTNNPDSDRYPEWSPDGQKISFSSRLYMNNDQIYVMNRDGSETINLSNNEHKESNPQWSPDGTKIMFSSQRGNSYRIYVKNSDGTDERWLGNGFSPTWSGDSRTIAYIQSWLFSGSICDILTVNADGSDMRELTNNMFGIEPKPKILKFDFFSKSIDFGRPNYNIRDYDPQWTPDSRKLVFVSNRDGNLEIYIMNADGSEPERLTYHPRRDKQPRISPDGKQIVFTSDRHGRDDIFVMNIDGSELKRLTCSGDDEHTPKWCPVSTATRKRGK